MVTSNVSLPRDAAQVGALLGSPEIAALTAGLEATRWTGRPGYPVRAMIGLVLVKAVYALPTWTRAVSLVRDHAGLRDVLGVPVRRRRVPVLGQAPRARAHAVRMHRQRPDGTARRAPGNGRDGRN